MDRRATENQSAALVGERATSPVGQRSLVCRLSGSHLFRGHRLYSGPRAAVRGLGRLWVRGLALRTYEYGIEALFERPSYQDLIVTPVGGLLLGAWLFDPIRDHIRR